MQTNTTTGYDTKIEIIPSRAERRRAAADTRRRHRYSKTGFVDRARYAPVAPKRRLDSNGNPLARPFTSQELHARAVTRREQTIGMVVALGRMKVISTHELARRLDTRAPHANRSTAERKHSDRSQGRTRAQIGFLTGVVNNLKGLHANGKTMPWQYMNAYARAVLDQEAPLAMAA